MMFKLIKWLIYSWTAICLLGVIAGIISVSEAPVPSSDAENVGATVGVALGLGFWALLWFIPTVGLGLIALIVRPRGSQLQPPVPETPTLCAECGKYFDGPQNFCPHCGKPVK